MRSTLIDLCIGAGIALALLALSALFGTGLGLAFAQPREALRHRAELTRIAHAEWGLDAPVPMFAAQVHQESGWQPQATSGVGAQGMAQFMPATARWWCGLHGLAPADCQPRNPTWALRALVGYDKYLFDRIDQRTDFDRSWGALRAYNGGLGHWQAEAARAAAQTAGARIADTPRAAIDAACGTARRAAVHCAENLAYPKRILVRTQPVYAAWGRVLAPDDTGGDR